MISQLTVQSDLKKSGTTASKLIHKNRVKSINAEWIDTEKQFNFRYVSAFSGVIVWYCIFFNWAMKFIQLRLV